MKMDKRQKSLLVAALTVTAALLVGLLAFLSAGKRIFDREGTSAKDFFKEEAVEFPE